MRLWLLPTEREEHRTMTTTNEPCAKLKGDDLVLFTPNVQGADRNNPLRAHMEISQADELRFNQLPPNENKQAIEIFDEVSQRFYVVRRAACGGNCYCAAEIVKMGSVKKHY